MKMRSEYDQALPKLRFSRPLLCLMVITILVFFVWAHYAMIDVINRVPGTLVASSKTKVIQSVDGGLITGIFVTEGSEVAEGDIVLSLGTEDALNKISDLETKRVTLELKIIRLRAEITNQPLVYPPQLLQYRKLVLEETLLYEKRAASHAEEVSALTTLIVITRRELDLLKPLETTGDIARSEIIEVEKQLSKLTSSKTNLQNEYARNLQDELTTLQGEILEVEQQLQQLKKRLDRANLRAPVNGVVKNMGVYTVAGVISPGQVVMEILPKDDALVVEGKVSPSEIASITLDSEVFIKIDAYDYTEFGYLKGRVTYISADTILEESRGIKVPYYRVYVAIDSSTTSLEKPTFDLIPGMTVALDIKAGRRSVLSYLTRPVTRALDQALTER